MNPSYLLLILLVFKCNEILANGLKLKQVLVLSRHNIRTPFPNLLSSYTPKNWPDISTKPGYLTSKGAMLEGYMGEYFFEWLKSEQFLSDMCPENDTLYVFANSVNRTIETAKAFVGSAFRGCNVTVNHKITNTEEEMDPIFDAKIHNNSDAFKDSVIKNIHLMLINNEKLTKAFSALNNILDFKNSEICRTNLICDLTDNSKTGVEFEVGDEIEVQGPLFIANRVTDTLKMLYYNGMPIEDVAWGFPKTPNMWETVTEVERQQHYIKFGKWAHDVGAPMITYLTSTFLKFDDMPKLMLIVGHDFNQMSMFYDMDFKEIRLPNQFELFPVGGKIVFQRWTDNSNDYLKIEYIYASWSQIRNGAKFSADNPPQRVLLELKWCEVDKNGFCPWNQFINKLRDRNL